MKLAGKVAVVTGAASGIGRATALLFATEGAAVVTADLNEAGAEAVAAAIRERGGRAGAIRVDVADGVGARAMVDNGHLELSTAEVVSGPCDLAAHVIACNRIVERAAADCGASAGLTQVDYTLAQTWGFHENLLVRDVAEVEAHIAPFLAARLILTGAGGINPYAPSMQFTLSPRTLIRTSTVMMLSQWPHSSSACTSSSK